MAMWAGGPAARAATTDSPWSARPGTVAVADADADADAVRCGAVRVAGSGSVAGLGGLEGHRGLCRGGHCASPVASNESDTVTGVLVRG